MITGEGASGRVTSVVVTSPDPLHGEFLPWHGLKLEVGNDNDGLLSPASSSQYSSCGESEFDKYCSANSILGTPSVCGSVGTFHDFHDSEFGSLRSFRSGDENGLEGFSLSGRLDLKFDNQRSLLMGGVDGYSRKNALFDARRGLGKRSNAELGHESRTMENDLSSPELGATSDLNTQTFGNYESGYNVQRDDSDLGVRQHSSMKGNTLGRENGEAIKDHILKMEVGKEESSHSSLSIEQVNCGLGGLNFLLGLGTEGSDGERCSDEGETLSRCDHSDGEDSMYGCDTDDEKQIRGYGRHVQEVSTKNENPLHMTSSIAFGSDDWDDFMQETREITSVSLVPDELMGKKQQRTETEGLNLKSTFTTTTAFQGVNVGYEQEDVREMPVRNQVQVAHELSVSSKTRARDHMKDRREITNGLLPTTNKEDIGNLPNIEDDLEIEGTPLTDGLNIMHSGLGGMHQQRSTKESTGIDAAHPSGSKGFGKTNSLVDPLSSTTDNIVCSTAKEAAENRKGQLFEDRKSHSLQPLTVINMKTTQKICPASLSITDDHHGPKKMDSLELNEFYDEIVHDMEEILMDSSKSHAARFTQCKTIHPSQVPPPLRDGGSTASTSSMNDTAPLICHSLKIEGVEVVGARQKKGDVSLGERLVGVKEYTVYKLRVWNGDNSWEVERRYRDFFTLYRRLNTLFSNQGWILPSPWLSVGPESRKFFGNASPDVVAERSVLIQECLQSILHSRFSPSHLSALIWFLSPQNIGLSSAYDTDVPPQTPIPISVGGIITESIYTRGQSISLIVEIRTSKSMRQMLEEQHYSCAGCHKHFDDGKTRIWELVQTLGWGKPRFCEYSGQLFCSSCHTNETAVLPARVLHQWDFARYPVSQLAKSYLDSIHDQPMLCVSAVNPFLFSRVPALQHVINVRKRIGGMLPYVRCPFRRSIYKELGSRRHILESNDFFALRDLIDLSKGVFAALPVMVETVSRKITEHITDRCLVCYDVGVPCSARQACDDPPSLIFPFQEGNVERCKSCGLVFHKPCFKRTAICPCGVQLQTSAKESGHVGSEVVGNLDLLGKSTDSKSSVGFLSGLFSKTISENLWQRRDNDTVFLMGSLPNTSL